MVQIKIGLISNSFADMHIKGHMKSFVHCTKEPLRENNLINHFRLVVLPHYNENTLRNAHRLKNLPLKINLAAQELVN